MGKTNHNKTYAVFIICLALIVSAFLLTKTPRLDLGKKKVNSVEPLIASNLVGETQSEDWLKILKKTKLDSAPTSTPNISFGPNDFDSSLATARMARDILSMYLENSNSGKINQDKVSQIVSGTLSNPDYLKVDSVTYVRSNININNENNKSGYKKYDIAFSQKLINRFEEIRKVEDPISIMIKTAESDNPKNLDKLNPIISANQGLIKDLLGISVPSNIAQLHLNVINTASNVLSDIQAMKKIFNDPVASLAATGQYNQHLSDFIDSLKKVDDFLKNN